jgi:hypothetical protein
MTVREVAFRTAVALVVATGPLTTAAAARGQPVIVYDEGSGADLLLNGNGRQPGLGSLPGVLQQWPARSLVPAALRAGKVTSFAATAETPSVVGLSADEMYQLLRERIVTSGSHTVFLDELTADFRSETGANFRSALAALGREPSPWGEDNLARHVHAYVPTPGWMLHDLAGWRDAWETLAMSGGVWLETFRARGGQPVAWTGEEWLSFPAAFADALREAGGDVRRLHLLFGPGPQADQWRLARTGPNCALLMNGPGAYRLHYDSEAFLREFHLAFGTDGAGRPRCLPELALGPGQRQALVGALRLAEGGRVAPAALTARPGLVAGRSVDLHVDLGRDPLRLAGRLRAPRAEFWRRARPRLRVVGVGVERTIRLPSAGRGTIPLHLRDSGALEVELLVDGSAIRAALGRPTNLVRSLAPRKRALWRVWPSLVASPATWNLTVPLRVAGRPRARATFEVPDPPGPAGPRPVHGGG